MIKKAPIIKQIIANLKEGNQLCASIIRAGAKPGTVWIWRKKYPRLELLIKAAQDKSDIKRNEMVVDALFKSAVNGNVGAMAFWLKNKQGWKDSPAVVVTTIIQQNRYEKVKDEDLDGVLEGFKSRR